MTSPISENTVLKPAWIAEALGLSKSTVLRRMTCEDEPRRGDIKSFWLNGEKRTTVDWVWRWLGRQNPDRPEVLHVFRDRIAQILQEKTSKNGVSKAITSVLEGSIRHPETKEIYENVK